MSENNWRISVQVGDGMIGGEINSESCEKKQKKKKEKKRNIISENNNNVSSRSCQLKLHKITTFVLLSSSCIRSSTHETRGTERKNVNMREHVNKSSTCMLSYNNSIVNLTEN